MIAPLFSAPKDKCSRRDNGAALFWLRFYSARRESTPICAACWLKSATDLHGAGTRAELDNDVRVCVVCGGLARLARLALAPVVERESLWRRVAEWIVGRWT